MSTQVVRGDSPVTTATAKALASTEKGVTRGADASRPAHVLPAAAEFIAVVTEDGQKLLLDFPQAFKAFYRHFAGHEVVLTLAKKSQAKTALQRRGFHAMIAPCAKEHGIQIEALKRDILAETFGYVEGVESKTGDRILAEPSTERLNKEQYSFLIENAMVLLVEWFGYVCIAPEEYKKMHPEKYPEYAREAKRGRKAA